MQKKVGILMFLVLLTVGSGFLFWKNFKTVEPGKTVYHYSYFSQPEFYEEAYGEAGKKRADKLVPDKDPGSADYTKGIGGVIVNHHLLAGHYIAEGFNTIATTAPVTVILISPNHFSTGRSSVITSAAVWKTPYGELEPNRELINQLTTQNIVSVEEQPFEQEHGISGIVAFIKRSLPNAKIVPIIVKDRLDLKEAKELADHLSQILDAHKLVPDSDPGWARYKTGTTSYIVVGSFDFSHYLTAPAADFHDEVSLAAVNNFDLESISRLDTDSRPGLLIFLKLLQAGGYSKFNLLEHNNSARVANRPETLETTSYITGYFTRDEINRQPLFSLLALGRIENSTTTLSALNRNSPAFGIKYLERLFYGQAETTAFVKNYDNKFENSLIRFGINQPVYNENYFALGSAKIVLSQNALNAHKLIDQGISVIITNEQNLRIEEYKGKIIVNGLGELLTAESLRNGSQSLAAGFIYSNNELKIYLLPIEFKDGEGKLVVGQKNAIILAQLADKAKTSAEIKEQIKSGIIRL